MSLDIVETTDLVADLHGRTLLAIASARPLQCHPVQLADQSSPHAREAQHYEVQWITARSRRYSAYFTHRDRRNRRMVITETGDGW